MANELTDSNETLAELSKLDDATLYIEQRREDEAEDRPLNEDEPAPDPEHKKLSRNARRAAAREALERDNESLRAQIEKPEQSAPKYDRKTIDLGAVENSLKFAGDKHGRAKFEAAFTDFVKYMDGTKDQTTYDRVMSASDVGEALIEWHAQQGGASQAPQAPQQAQADPYQAALEQGRQDTRFQSALQEREAQIRVETAAQFRAQEFAKSVPDFHEALAGVDGLDTVPAPMLDMIHRSEFGPAIAYMLAKDCWEGQGVLLQLAELDGNPIAQAQLVGRLEQIAQNQMNRAASPPQRTTKAPPPIKPIHGGANAPTDLHALAKQDTGDEYIRARRKQGG
jgi:hypothetical protein